MMTEEKPPEPSPDEDQPEPPIEEPPTQDPPVEDPPPRNRRKHRSCCYQRTVLVASPRNSDLPTIWISDLGRNLEALFGPRPKAGARGAASPDQVTPG